MTKSIAVRYLQEASPALGADVLDLEASLPGGATGRQLYTHSFLGYGLEQVLLRAERQVNEAAAPQHTTLQKQRPEDGARRTHPTHPCLPPGYKAPSGARGGGNFTACRALAASLLPPAGECRAGRCAIGDVYTPELKGTFLAIGEQSKCTTFCFYVKHNITRRKQHVWIVSIIVDSEVLHSNVAHLTANHNTCIAAGNFYNMARMLRLREGSGLGELEAAAQEHTHNAMHVTIVTLTPSIPAGNFYYTARLLRLRENSGLGELEAEAQEYCTAPLSAAQRRYELVPGAPRDYHLKACFSAAYISVVLKVSIECLRAAMSGLQPWLYGALVCSVEMRTRQCFALHCCGMALCTAFLPAYSFPSLHFVSFSHVCSK